MSFIKLREIPVGVQINQRAVNPEPETPLTADLAELPCHRCGSPVIVTAHLAHLFALGNPIVVECERGCVRTLPVKGESDAD